jgi:hypothetical protein
MRRICQAQAPSVVLTFGKVATDAINALRKESDSPISDVVHLSAPHPASRIPDKYQQLRAMRDRLLALQEVR